MIITKRVGQAFALLEKSQTHGSPADEGVTVPEVDKILSALATPSGKVGHQEYEAAWRVARGIADGPPTALANLSQYDQVMKRVLDWRQQHNPLTRVVDGVTDEARASVINGSFFTDYSDAARPVQLASLPPQLRTKLAAARQRLEKLMAKNGYPPKTNGYYEVKMPSAQGQMIIAGYAVMVASRQGDFYLPAQLVFSPDGREIGAETCGGHGWNFDLQT